MAPELILGGPADAPAHARAGHPERPARVTAVTAGVDDLHLGQDLEVVTPVEVSLAHLLRVHDQDYLSRLEAFCQAGGGELDPDTYAGPGSWRAARLAAGTGLAAVEALERRGTGVAFVAARPPGHHALREGQMGFCLVNNVSVAAAHLAERGERVLVLDWDVHHGNGSQAIFWNDPRVLYVSTHQWPLYPGTGRPDETGGPAAPGLTVNVPLPPGATGDVVRRALDQVVVPVVERFSPTWVLVSAGFDAHRADPLGGLALSAGDFADLARAAAAMAPRPGRLALFLEGGYDLGALRSSVTATLGAVLDAPDPPERQGGDERPTAGGPGCEMVAQVMEARARALDRA
ncbi:MAG TPA: histone deacetylase [Acidimicrobiales bacterium]|nr:histone deacetylase [Acidimicrobiales bacterium]